jgi:hypothetical protein
MNIPSIARDQRNHKQQRCRAAGISITRLPISPLPFVRHFPHLYENSVFMKIYISDFLASFTPE